MQFIDEKIKVLIVYSIGYVIKFRSLLFHFLVYIDIRLQYIDMPFSFFK